MVSRGFSLIELMVTLLVMALLVLAALPFGGAWLDGQRQGQLRNALLEGIGQARAQALRNSRCLLASETGFYPEAARLYYRNQQVQLILPEATSSCTDTPSWPADDAPPWWQSGTMGSRVQLAYADGTAFTCLGFDTRGLPVTTCNEAGTAPATVNQVVIKTGNQEPLYADLR